MSARLTAPPRPTLSGSGKETAAPPRAMAHAAQRGNRRRAWPRWARPALKMGIVMLPLLGLGGGVWWTWKQANVGGAVAGTPSALIRVAADMGFQIGDVMVEGRTATEPGAILEALGVRRGDPILGLDLTEAKERLEQLPWVSSASIERRLPDTLHVRLSERQPMAIWQHERQFTVIDRDGRPLADATELARRGNKHIETLPQVVGINAPQQVTGLLAALEKVPTLHKRVTAATWISDRRWDLKFDNGVVVKLPEARMLTALRQLAEMQATGKVLERDVVAIDLRQPDRAVLQTAAALFPDDDGKKKRKPGDKT